MPSRTHMQRMALLSAAAACLVGAWSVSAPAQAGTIYWCKDGTAVAYKSSCNGRGGVSMAAREGTSGDPTTAAPCIFDRWGKHKAGARACALPTGKEADCLKGGGAVFEKAGGKFCQAAPTGVRPAKPDM